MKKVFCLLLATLMLAGCSNSSILTEGQHSVLDKQWDFLKSNGFNVVQIKKSNFEGFEAKKDSTTFNSVFYGTKENCAEDYNARVYEVSNTLKDHYPEDLYGKLEEENEDGTYTCQNNVIAHIIVHNDTYYFEAAYNASDSEETINLMNGMPECINGKSTAITGAPAETPTPTATPTPTETPTPTATPTPDPLAGATTSQRQALSKAKSYLNLSGFSYQGLIDQLSSQYGEGFSVEDATFAVDHCEADWNAEALEKAKSYLSMSGFSYQGIIDQLSSNAGDKFTVEQATYAADNCGADWNQEAVEAGQSYLQLGGFSRSRLIEQLSSNSGSKFTKEQATYAADQLGL